MRSGTATPSLRGGVICRELPLSSECVAYVRQSRPDSGEVKVLEPFSGVPFSLGRGLGLDLERQCRVHESGGEIEREKERCSCGVGRNTQWPSQAVKDLYERFLSLAVTSLPIHMGPVWKVQIHIHRFIFV